MCATMSTLLQTAEVPFWRYFGAGTGFLVFSIAAWWNMVKGIKPDRRNIGNFVAFNASIAVIGGVTLVVGSSEHWPGLLLAAGACLGIGFLLGLLFGYPRATKPTTPQTTPPATPKSDGNRPSGQGPDAKQAPQAGSPAVPAGNGNAPAPGGLGGNAPPAAGAGTPPPAGGDPASPANANNAPGGGLPAQTIGAGKLGNTGGNGNGAGLASQGPTNAADQTLLQQSVDALSKLVAGATLAGMQPLSLKFQEVAKGVTQMAFPESPDTVNVTYGVVLTSYFLIVGFLTGILLPNLYHLIEPPGDDSGGR